MRTFKKKRSIKLDYYGQGYIYFVCANYRRLPQAMRTRLDRIVRDVGGFDEAALRRLLFDVTSSVQSVSLEYNVNEYRLNVLRDEFYRRTYKELTLR